MTLTSGSLIKGYRIGERIGAGGFGAVYRAEQSTVGREVAVKVILPSFANQPEFIRRFETEAQVAARLEHMHIVPLYDYWRDPEGAYLVMRLLRGGSLQEALRDGPFDLEEAAVVLDQISAGLALAHRNQIIHRDIKPSNILLDEDGNAYLTDFGIAKVLNSGVSLMGNSQGMIGSPDYVAPEQARSEPITPQTDIYSMGVVLYEMLTGEHPFKAGSPIERLFSHINDPVPTIGGMEPDITEGINHVIQKATAKNPKDRYEEIIHLANDFRLASGLSVSRAGTNIVELLTPREQEVLQSLVEGSSNREMAKNLAIELSTVKWYLTQVFKKLNVRSRAQAIVKAREMRLIADEVTFNAIDAQGRRPPPENPYKGLRAFQTIDAQDFHGRDRLIRKLLSRMESDEDYGRFLAVVGPSGSGKSSLVRAGLIPALWRGDLPGSEKWYVVEMVPGSSPLEELETALIRIAAEQGANIGDYLRRNENGLLRIPGLILADDFSELVVVIDQFEEIFTLVEKEADRLYFLDMLIKAVTDERSRVRVIITLRADFYDRPLGYAAFGTLMQNRVATVLPLSADELEQAIVEPARRVGVDFEDGLVQNMIDEILYQPGMLPLLQYALTELFEVREGRLLTFAGYESIGKAFGALGMRAEEIYLGLGPEGQELTRQVFLRLVTLGEGTEDTRRRAPHTELLSVAEDPDQVEEIIDTFTNYRLLSLDHDPETRAPTVEVAHEAILVEWARLRGWLDQSREDIRRQRRLARASRDWERSGRDASFLLRGTRLESLLTWRESTGLTLTQTERDFLNASSAAMATERAEAASRAARERALEQRSRTVMRILIGVFAAATLAALFLTNFAFQQRAVAQENAAAAQFEALARATQQAAAEAAQQEAERQAGLAAENEASALAQKAIVEEQSILVQRQADLNHSRFLAAQSQLALKGNNGQLAYALAMMAVQLEDPPEEAELALSEAAYAPGTYRLMSGHAGEIFAAWLSPDENTLQSYSVDHTLRTWDIRSGIQIRKVDLSSLDLPDHPYSQRAAAFSPDGQQFLLALQDYSLVLLDTATGEILLRMAGHASPVLKVAFSPEGQTAMSGSGPTDRNEPPPGADLSMRLWDLKTGEEIRRFDGHTNSVFDLAFSPDGRTAVTGGWDSTIIHWDLETGAPLHIMKNESDPAFFFLGDVYSLAISPDGRFLLAGSDFNVNIWDLENGQRVQKLAKLNAIPRSSTISQDSRLTAVGNLTGEIRIWDLETGSEQLQLTGDSTIIQLDFGSSDKYLYSVVGELLQAWEIKNGAVARRFEQPGNIIYDLAYSPDGRTAVYLDQTASTLVLLELETGNVIRRIDIPGQGWWVAYTPDSASVFVTMLGGAVIQFDLGTGTEIQRLGEGHDTRANGVAVSPDGRLALTGAQGEGEHLLLWDVQSGERLMAFDTVDVMDVAVSPDGRTALSGGADNRLVLWDLETGSALREFEGHNGFIWEVAFSPNGETALSASWDSTLILWDVRTGELIHRLLGHTDIVRGVAFHPDGNTAVSGSRDGTLILWSLETGKAIRRYQAHNATINAVAFSPDGTRVLSSGEEGMVIEWRIDDTLEELVTWAEANRYLPELSCAERSLFNIEPLCSSSAGQAAPIRVCFWEVDEEGLADEEYCSVQRNKLP